MAVVHMASRRLIGASRISSPSLLSPLWRAAVDNNNNHSNSSSRLVSSYTYASKHQRSASALGMCHRDKRRILPVARSLSSTYYDSQSGLHVPLHNENEISIYVGLDVNEETSINWGDDNSMPKMEGIRGLALLPNNSTSESANSSKILSLAETIAQNAQDAPELQLFLPWSALKHMTKLPAQIDNLIPVIPYKDDIDAMESMSINNTHVSKTAIALIDPENYDDPVTTASGVASWIDSTGQGDFVWVGKNGEDTNAMVDVDDMVQLCEELAYLDVPGPTMKSRLIVDLSMHTMADPKLNH